jgi:hypothetical protein
MTLYKTNEQIKKAIATYVLQLKYPYEASENDAIKDQINAYEQVLYQRDTGFSSFEFVHVPGLHGLFEAFKTCDFDAEIPPKHNYNRAWTADAWETATTDRLQKTSWFVEENWPGPFGHVLPSLFTVVQPHWMHFITTHGIDKQYDPAKYTVQAGVHKYDMTSPYRGLGAHEDLGLVSMIYSDQPLQGYMSETRGWRDIKIPHDHFMLFTGKIGAAACPDFQTLVHRVDHTEIPKFTIGVFVGPNPKDSVVNSAVPMTVAEFGEQYFENARIFSDLWDAKD